MPNLKRQKIILKTLLLATSGFLLSFSFASAKNFTVYNATNVNQPYFSVNGTTGNVGIGTTNPTSILQIPNNGWISGLNNAGTGAVNMFRINSSDQIEVGAPLNIGSFEFSPDSGLVTLVDMPVSATPIAGTPEAYVLKIDGENLMTVYAESNALGGIQNKRIIMAGNVGIGTTAPNDKLSIGLAGVAAPAGSDSTGHNYTSTYLSTDNYALTNYGLVKTLIAGGSGSSVGYWTMNGTDINNSNAGNVGIGTTGPGAKLDINGDARINHSGAATFTISDSSGDAGETANLVLSDNVGNWTAKMSQYIGAGGANQALRFYSSNATPLTLFTTGNASINSQTDFGTTLGVNGSGYFSGSVGIGASASTAKLEVTNTATGGRGVIINAGWEAGGVSVLTIKRQSLGAIDFYPDMFDGGHFQRITFTTDQPTNKRVQFYGASKYIYDGALSIGNSTNDLNSNSKFEVLGSITAASALARGAYMNNTLVAAANNDSLIGLDINPTFTNGAFTGVSDIALRTVTGNVLLGITSGSVGIGTTAPNDTLSIGNSGSAPAGSSATGHNYTSTYLSTDNYALVNYGLLKTMTDPLVPGGSNSLWNGTTTGNIWNANSGNVGIGTTNPLVKLDIAGTGGASGGNAFQRVTSYSSTYSDWQGMGGFSLAKSHSNTVGTLATTLNGEALGAMSFVGVDSGNNSYTQAQIYVTQAGPAISGAWGPARMDFIAGDSSGNFTPGLSILGKNVGIGTTNPQTKLHLLVPDDGGIRIQAGESGWGSARLEFYSDPIGANQWRPGYIASNNTGSYGGILQFYTNGTGSGYKEGSVLGMSIYNGNVGVGGVVTPGTKLHIASNVNAMPSTGEGFRMGNIAGDYYHSFVSGLSTESNDSNYLALKISTITANTPTEVMRLLGSGNVGIGTTGPNDIFSIGGDAGVAAPGGSSKTGHNYTSTYLSTDNYALVNYGLLKTMTDPLAPGGSNSLWNGTTTGNIWNANSGNVGIGVAAPGDLLHLLKTTASTSTIATVLRLDHTDSGTPAGGFGQAIDFYTKASDNSNSKAGSIVFKKADAGIDYNQELGFYVNAANIQTPMLRLISGTAALLGTNITNANIPTLNGSFTIPVTLSASAGTNGYISSISNTSDAAVGNKSTLFFSAWTNYNSNPTAYMSTLAGITAETIAANSTDIKGDLVFSTTWGGWALPTEKMRIRYDGNVGIGTTNPGYKLEVNGTIGVASGNDVTIGTTTTAGSVRFSGDRALVGYDGTSAYFKGGGGKSIILQPNGATALTLLGNGTGNVGIGTTAPNDKLSIGLAGVAAPAGSDSTGHNYTNSYLSTDSYALVNYGLLKTMTDPLAPGGSNSLWNGTTTGNIWNANAGNVGIGTTSPNAKIESLATTEQLRLSYDATHYASLTTDSNGQLSVHSSAGGTINIYKDLYNNGAIAIGGTDYRGVLTVQKSDTSTFAANTDPSDTGRSFVMENTNTTNAANQYSNVTLQINPTGSLPGGRVLGDLRLVRETLNQTNSYFLLSAFRQDGTYKDFAKIGYDNSYFVGNVGIGTTNPGTYGAKLAVHIGTDMNLGIRTNAGLGYGATSGVGLDALNDTADVPVAMGFRASSYQFNLGNVGIGTTAPNDKLSIGLAGVAAPAGSDSTGHNYTNSYLSTDSYALVNYGLLKTMTDPLAPGGSNSLWNGTTTGNIWNANSGNVGIGTTGPTATLTVKGLVGTTATALKVISDSNADDFVYQFTGADGTAAQTMVMTQPGNVGIGTTNPVQKLEVNGNILAGNTGASTYPYLNLKDTSIGAYVQGVTYDTFLTNNSRNTDGTNWARDNVNYGSMVLRLRTAASGGSKGSLDIFQQVAGSGTFTLPTSSFTLDQGGNVGIGIAVPVAKLDIRGTYSTISASMTSGLVNLVSTNAAAVDIGSAIKFAGETGNGTTPYAFSAILGAKASAIANNYTGYLSFQTTSDVGSLLERMRINGAGYVGIDTTGPNDKLSIGLAGVAAPAGSPGTGHNYTSTYLSTDDYALTNYGLVKTLIQDWVGTTTPVAGGYLPLAGGTMSGSIYMGTNNITDIWELHAHKITADTFDPLYTINGVNYSTFAPAISGGVREEYVGKIKLEKKNKSGEFETVINFAEVPAGSDLWLWRKVVEFNKDNIDIAITPYGGFAQVYYLIDGNRLIFRSDRSAEISYRLIGRRFDWRQWPSRSEDQATKGMEIK